MHELLRNIDVEQTTMLFKFLEKKLIKVKLTQKDKDIATKLDTHFSDALHIVLASKANADAIVTRNVKDFQLFKTYRPEDL